MSSRKQRQAEALQRQLAYLRSRVRLGWARELKPREGAYRFKGVEVRGKVTMTSGGKLIGIVSP